MRTPYSATPGQRVWVIVLAGGGGQRFGGAKQFSDLGGRTLLQRSIDAAAPVAGLPPAGSGAAGGGIVVVLPSGAEPSVTLAPYGREPTCALLVTTGGAQRADSVRAGLARVPEDATVIVIADAAHPLATPALFRTVTDAVLSGADGAVPGLPLTEVIATVDEHGVRTGGIRRDGHVLVQMPHAFRASSLRHAHARADASTAVEDSALVARGGGTVVVVPGEPWNIHVTTSAELEMARALVRGRVM